MTLPTRGVSRRLCAYRKKNSPRPFAVALPSFGSARFRKGAYWKSMKPSRGTAAIRGMKSSVKPETKVQLRGIDGFIPRRAAVPLEGFIDFQYAPFLKRADPKDGRATAKGLGEFFFR